VSDGRIVQLSVSAGGVPKLAVPAARLTGLGLQGDAHRYEHHGGPERAVCLFSLEAIDALAAEGHAIEPGAIGENVTVEGIDWNLVTPGVRLRLGERVVLQDRPRVCRGRVQPCVAETEPGLESRLRARPGGRLAPRR
jgi:MOSC domain-containing protein YiiM